MTAHLTAEFERQFADGPLIRAALNLPTEAFSITVLFGPSGSGKTTILRCLAGLERPDQGQILFGAETWFDAAKRIHLPPQQRGIGFFFQEYALFPHLNLERNVAFGLSGLAARERRRRAHEAIAFVGLQGLEDRYPKQLSGGQQQRVALARTLVKKPRLLLLDEPLSALDAPSRSELRRELRRLLAGLGAPTLLVTHDRIEALALGDTVVVLNEGHVCQSGPVHEVFARPASPAVASIVGIETVVQARILQIADGLATVAVGEVHLMALAPDARVGEGFVCIRAEEIILEKHEPAPSSARNRLPGRVVTMEPEGPMIRVSVDCGFRLAALVTNQACRELGLRPGDSVIAVIKAPAIHVIGR